MDNTLFYNPTQYDISMIKGDTMSFGFQLQGLDNTPPDDITFTCKETPESSEPLFELYIDNGIEFREYDSETDTATYSLRLPPEATQELAVGRYFYDLQLTAGDDVLTLLIGRFAIDYEITNFNA